MDTTIKDSSRVSSKQAPGNTQGSLKWQMYGFIGGFLLMLIGLMTGFSYMAGFGFVAMVVSFILLNVGMGRRYRSYRYKLTPSGRFDPM